MSRFIDGLKKISQAAPQPIGFKAANAAQSQIKMLLVAGLAQAGSAGLSDYVAGADAGLLEISDVKSGVKAIKEATQTVPDIPWGVRLKDVDEEGVSQIAEAGGDFVVFMVDSAVLAAIQSGTVGRILEIEISLNEDLLRSVNKLPVDAVLISIGQQDGHFLTWHHLMRIQRFADLLTKPLLVSIPSNVALAELQALWDAGVDGIVVGAVKGQPVGRLMELRQAIDGLPPASRHKRGETAVLLPYASHGMDRVTEEPEED